MPNVCPQCETSDKVVVVVDHAHQKYVCDHCLNEWRDEDLALLRGGTYREMLRDAQRRIFILENALREATDVAIWMSGSSSFAPEGEAGAAWPSQRERLYAAIFTLDSNKDANAWSCTKCGDAGTGYKPHVCKEEVTP